MFSAAARLQHDRRQRMSGSESRVLPAPSGHLRRHSGSGLRRLLGGIAGTLVAASILAPAPALASTPAVIYASATAGSGGTGTQQQPYTLPAAEVAAHN